MSFLSKLKVVGEITDLSMMSYDELCNLIKNFKGPLYGNVLVTPVTETFWVKISKTDFLYMLKTIKDHSPDPDDKESRWNIYIDDGDLYIGKQRR